ncbi:MAG TPA: hypothetical protein VNM87_05365, partial [Candidatus Udaeobacter sp.]|nr:hypothetical protein [Candidatus Udaeobacter sp.]
PRDALSRLETMILMAGIPLPSRAMREQVSAAIQVVIQIGRLPDGNRRILSVSEIVGMEGDIISMQDIFTFERQGVSPQGEILGRFRSTGVRPGFADRIEISGFTLPRQLFDLKTSDGER